MLCYFRSGIEITVTVKVSSVLMNLGKFKAEVPKMLCCLRSGIQITVTVEISFVVLRIDAETLALVFDIFIQMLGGVILRNQGGTPKLKLFACPKSTPLDLLTLQQTEKPAHSSEIGGIEKEIRDGILPAP